MAVLDQLFIRLGFDGSAFIQGTKKAGESLTKIDESINKSGRSITDMGKQGADAFSAFRREALGALALFTGGASIAKFTGDMAQANTALGNLSRQLDIAPQKLTQLHEAMKATGGNSSDVDSIYQNMQAKSSTNEGINQLSTIGRITGIQVLDKNQHVRADVLDQLAHSKRFQSLNRAVQDNYIQQLGGNRSITNMVTRKDYDELKKRFDNLGPTKEQIKQGEQLLADWTELKANTDKVAQNLFSQMEPTIHNFIQSLISLEKAHPKEIADGMAALAVALTTISALLTAKSFLSVLSKIGAIGGGATVKSGAVGASGKKGLGSKLFLAGAAIELFASPSVKADDKKAIQEGNDYEDLVQHYKKRTGAWTALNFDEGKEREIVQKEHPHEIEKKQLPTETEQPDYNITNQLELSHNDLFRHYIKRTNDQTGFSFNEGKELQLVQNEQQRAVTDNTLQKDDNLNMNRLLGAVAMQESSGNPNAVNARTGAAGMFQFMAPTAREQGLANPFDAQQSWDAANRYISSLIKRFHSVDKALAAYNWGQGNVAKNIRLYGENWKAYLPKETSNYLAKVNHNYETGHVVHNNNVSNNPTINIAINGDNRSPSQIRQAAHQGVINALQRHEEMRTG